MDKIIGESIATSRARDVQRPMEGEEPFNPQRMEIARMRRLLGRRELAKRLGVSPQIVARWCHGLSMPSKKQVRTIAAVLEWPIGFFYGPDLDAPDMRYISFRNVTAL